MKVNFKKIGVEVEADAECLIEKGINAHENDWKEKRWNAPLPALPESVSVLRSYA